MNEIDVGRRRVREAIGLDRLRTVTGRVALSGFGEFYGTDVSCRLEYDGRGRFVTAIDGRIRRSTGFDGECAWDGDGSGVSSALEMDERETLLLSNWFRTGWWLADECPVDVAFADSTTAGELAFSIRLKGGVRCARVVVDGATHRPRTLSVPSAFGELVWTLDDWREVDGLSIPRRVEHRLPANVTQTTVVTSIGTRRAPGVYARPASAPAHVRFDASIPSRIEVERAPTGHLFVRPRIDGKDVGWFILDTGAAVSVISPEAADEAGLPVFGKTFGAGAGAATPSAVFRESTGFELGPIEISARLAYTQLDLSANAAALGRSVAGVVGWDLFCRAIVSIDMTEPRVEIFDGSSHDDAGLEWQTVFLHGRHPHVRARVEGAHEGLFRLDTGGGSAGLFFHSPAVERLRLSEGRTGQEVGLGGAGGTAKALMSHVESFELAGERFENLPAFFVARGFGAFDDPYSLGTIAGAVLGRFKMVLDYERRRIAFISRERGHHP
ncbi:MAG: retropepsin-like domain-containing protein [Planctomycetes bacterium]|nr:retropepsin-like domain-containing protein [Planctomycetota bacterium]